MSKKLTEAQIQAQALGLGIEVAALKAVIEVECKGSGFNADGTPVILFERHVFRQRLIANKRDLDLALAMRERPDLCNKSAGGYGLYSAQHGRLNAAAQYHRESALESASWGIFLSCLSGSERSPCFNCSWVAFLSCLSGSERIASGSIQYGTFLSCLSGSERL